MRFSHVKILYILLCAHFLASTGASASLDVVTLMEQQIRSRVRVEVLPEYPVAAIKERAKGVVVAQVEFDTEGFVTKVEILETTNKLFAEPTTKAVYRWRFAPIVTPKGKALSGRGKLTFYFYYKNRRGWSENPLIFSRGLNRRKE